MSERVRGRTRSPPNGLRTERRANGGRAATFGPRTAVQPPFAVRGPNAVWGTLGINEPPAGGDVSRPEFDVEFDFGDPGVPFFLHSSPSAERHATQNTENTTGETGTGRRSRTKGTPYENHPNPGFWVIFVRVPLTEITPNPGFG